MFTDWLQQSHILPRYELSLYTISEGTTESKHTYRQINVTENQPNTNTDAKCTAIHIGVNLEFTWITVQCDHPFEATFFCQKQISRQPVDFTLALNPRNATCQDGGIQIKGSSKCQIILKTPAETLSFLVTKEVCSAVGGSVFSVNSILRTEPLTIMGKHIVGHLQNTFLVKKNIDIPPEYKDPVTLLEFFFGQHVDHATIQRTLAALLYTAETELISLKFIVNVDHRCGLLATSR